jgi:hypothetical protein
MVQSYTSIQIDGFEKYDRVRAKERVNGVFEPLESERGNNRRPGEDCLPRDWDRHI